jgi:hypothetical protein
LVDEILLCIPLEAILNHEKILLIIWLYYHIYICIYFGIMCH